MSMLAPWEAKVRILEEQDIIHNLEHCKSELNKGLKYIRWLGLQESLLKQKAKINWFQEGDYNSK